MRESTSRNRELIDALDVIEPQQCLTCLSQLRGPPQCMSLSLRRKHQKCREMSPFGPVKCFPDVGGPCVSRANERKIVRMSERTTSSPTEGALRAATEIETDGSRREATANLIDRETGLRELSQILEGPGTLGATLPVVSTLARCTQQ